MITETIINASSLTIFGSILIFLFKNYQKLVLTILKQNDENFKTLTKAFNETNENLIEHTTLVKNEIEIIRRH